MNLLPVFLKLDGRPGLRGRRGSCRAGKDRQPAQDRAAAPRCCAECTCLKSGNSLSKADSNGFSGPLNSPTSMATSWSSPPPILPKSMPPFTSARVERGILANSVDDPPHCDFYFGSVVSRGKLQIAISTAGESPAFAQRLRREIDEQLPEDLGPWLEDLGRLRREVLATHPRGESRRLLLHQLAQRPALRSGVLPLAPFGPRAAHKRERQFSRNGLSGGSRSREIQICSPSRRCASFSQPTSSCTTTLFRKRFLTWRSPPPRSSTWASAAA